MTIKTRVECDGYGCGDMLDVDECDTPGITMSFSGWREDPDDPSQHYCKRCWSAIDSKDKEED